MINVAANRTAMITPEGEGLTVVEGSCPEGRFTDTSATLTQLGTTTAISINLI